MVLRRPADARQDGGRPRGGRATGHHTAARRFQRFPHRFLFSAVGLRRFDTTLNRIYYYVTMHFNVIYGRSFLISLFW